MGLLSCLEFRGLYRYVNIYFRVYTKIFLHGIGCVVILGVLAWELIRDILICFGFCGLKCIVK